MGRYWNRLLVAMSHFVPDLHAYNIDLEHAYN